MGYRGKLLVEHTGIELPREFVEKYREQYHIGEHNGKHFLNIASKWETKYHGDIIDDLEELVKNAGYPVWAVTLWEDGVVRRYNLTSGDEERIGNGDFEN